MQLQRAPREQKSSYSLTHENKYPKNHFINSLHLPSLIKIFVEREHYFVFVNQMCLKRSSVRIGSKNTLELFGRCVENKNNKITSLPRSFINSMRA